MDGGEIVRRVHWRAWRGGGGGAAAADPDAPAPEVSTAELVSVLPLLIESGSVGVVWPRLRDAIPAGSAVGMALEAAVASQAAHNARVEGEIARVVGRLHDAGIQPVLIKGLAVARLYPSPLVRPAGDIDLVVRDEEYDLAREVLAGGRCHLSFHGDRDAKGRVTPAMDRSTVVDLHAVSNWDQRPGDAFFDHTSVMRTGDVNVRVPCVEDHIRSLCKHFLVHGVTRPLRLCDIALLFESEAEHMDWARLLRGSRREVEQIKVTLGIAESMLGMGLDGTPMEREVQVIPSWVIPAVHRQVVRDPRRRTPLREFYAMLLRPWRSLEIARANWPDPFSASVRLGAPLNSFPRLPIQWAFVVTRLVTFVTQILPRDIASRWRSR